MRRIMAAVLVVLLALSFYTDICATGDAGAEMSAAERLRSGLEAFEEVIELSEFNIAPDELGRIFSDATKNSPYLFYVDNRLSYTYKTGGCVVSVTPKYNTTKEEAEGMLAFCHSEIEGLARLAALGESELERVRLAHDLICTRYSYDVTLESNNLYSFLKNGCGTCQGYTWAYMAVLREMGIECEYTASDTIDHIWLKVKIDGEWYHSDVTWDDPPGEQGDDYGISRRHFLFSDKKADADGYKDRYGAGDTACTSELYDNETERYVCGDLGLCELLSLRIYVEYGERVEYFCPVCADLDGDLRLTEDDVALLRQAILSRP